VLKGTDDGCTVRRISAGEVEAAVMDQVRALLRQPEVVIGTWRAAQAEAPDLTEAETRCALGQFDPLWDELFPAEQARIVRLLVERVEVIPTGADIRLRLDGFGGPGARSAGIPRVGSCVMSASITVRVPVTIRKRSGRRSVVALDGAPWARGHRWKKMLDDGRYGSVTALAAGEKVDRGYLGKILMLTLLAPEIVEAIINGRQTAELGVRVLREGFPVEWGVQRRGCLI